MEALDDTTTAVIIDASAIGSVDVTAARMLVTLDAALSDMEITLYITEHIGQLNVQLRQLGLGYMIEEGRVRLSLEKALADNGLSEPYPLVGVHNSYHDIKRKREQDELHEHAWAFGE